MKWVKHLGLLLIAVIGYADQTILVDPYWSPFAGSADLMFTQELLVWGEDAWLGGKGSKRDTTGKIWGRALEQLFVWHNINMLAAVAQHEIFGHGYRLRELGVTPKKYEITPWGGATYFHVDDSFKVGKMLAVNVAGLEAEAIMARDIKMEWMRRGVIDGRLATNYTQAQQSLFWYTVITKLGEIEADAFSGNDVSSYAFLINASYPNGKLSLGKLTRWSLFNLLDPMTFYAYYAFFYYIAEGKAWKFPMITINEEIKYLPNIRIGYAPYAPEAYLENFFTFRGEPIYFYLKGGRRSFGVGAAYDKLWWNRRGTIGFRLDGWNQNHFISSATLQDLEETHTAFRPILKKRTWGGALSVTGTINLFSQLALYAELGGKSSGYLPGYSLGKELVTRIGLRIGPNMLGQKKITEDYISDKRSF